MQLPGSEKNYMPTLVNVEMNGSDAKMVEKVGAATIVANKATWPATVQSINRHPEDKSVENQGGARREEIRVKTVRDGFVPDPRARKGPPSVPVNPKRIRHLGVSMSKEPNLSMRLC